MIVVYWDGWDRETVLYLYRDGWDRGTALYRDG